MQSALVPVLVRGLLSSHVAEHVACGMSHVAVVATQRSKAGSGTGGNTVTRLLTWGQNSRGQLGIGEGREDHFLPQVGDWVGLAMHQWVAQDTSVAAKGRLGGWLGMPEGRVGGGLGAITVCQVIVLRCAHHGDSPAQSSVHLSL